MQPSMRPSNAPSRYGRYEVLFRIAAGGMAEVYVARLVGEGGFEKLVALKRMLPTLAEDDRFVGMFLDEGKVAANISSPHVVSTLDMGRAEDDSLYLVMELVVGVSLSALLRVMSRAGEMIPPEVAVELLAQAAMGLEDAHEARTIYGEALGIVHRDVSPQNVLIDVTGRVRITDFGVARALARVTQTQSGEVKGKLAYFAPEQARAQPLDRRADVYALGIVGWELLAGQRLFAGEGPADTLTNVLEKIPERLDVLRPELPTALADAIAHALQRDVSARTPTAGQLAAELRAAVPGAGAAALGRFVRARGGESLLRLEEGIRSLVPSTPSALSAAARPSVAPVVSDGEELTTRTPSVSQVLEVKTGAPAPLAPATAPSPIAAPVSLAPSAPPRRSAPLIVAGVASLVALGAAGVWVSSQRAAPIPAGVPTSLPVIEPAPAPIAPPPVPAAALPETPIAPALAEPDAIDPDPAAVEEDEAGARSAGARGRPRDRGRTAAADETSAAASEPTEARPSSGSAATEPATTARRHDEPEARAPGPGTSGLRGMDDFDSELGGGGR